RQAGEPQSSDAPRRGRMIPSSTSLLTFRLTAHPIEHVSHCDLIPCPTGPVPHLRDVVGGVAPDNNDGRHAKKLSIAKLHSGRNFRTIVKEDVDTGLDELSGKGLRLIVNDRILPCRDEVHIEG